LAERVGAMFSLRRLCAVVLVGGLAALGIGAAPAAARVREHFQFHDTSSEIVEDCGLKLRQDVDIRGMLLETLTDATDSSTSPKPTTARSLGPTWRTA
jgi:hypothetical protein